MNGGLRWGRVAATIAASGLVLVVGLPFVGLLSASSPSDIAAGLSHPLFIGALRLTAWTSTASLAVIVVLGTPLAWKLARSSSRAARLLQAALNAPVVVPPAALGIALLMAFGRRGLLGPALQWLGADIAFTAGAVVLAQVVVASPFYVQAAVAAFRRLDDDQLLVARSLGASPAAAFLRVAVPEARPGLLAGAGLAWARAVGEFGATLLFAGSLAGVTQTMPLAIYAALEVDLRVAVSLSVVLMVLSVTLLSVGGALGRRSQ